MSGICILGEPICEIMRTAPDRGLKKPDIFMGPYPSGAPAIFADTVAKLKCRSTFIGTVGDDEFGKAIQEKLLKDGVDCTYLSVSEALSTGVAFVSYKSNGDRTFIFHIGNAAAGQIIYPETLPADIDIFHVMGCSMMPSEQMANSIISASRYYYTIGKTISFDPNIRIESLKNQNLKELVAPIMEICSILMPGVEEMLAIAGTNTINDAVNLLFKKEVLKIIVLKNGEHGSRIITRDMDISVPNCSVKVQDTTGAGDSFDAAFLVSYLCQKELIECTRDAAATAALNCAAFGPMEGKISPEAVAELVNKNYK